MLLFTYVDSFSKGTFYVLFMQPFLPVWPYNSPISWLLGHISCTWCSPGDFVKSLGLIIFVTCFCFPAFLFAGGSFIKLNGVYRSISEDVYGLRHPKEYPFEITSHGNTLTILQTQGHDGRVNAKYTATFILDNEIHETSGQWTHFDEKGEVKSIEKTSGYFNRAYVRDEELVIEVFVKGNEADANNPNLQLFRIEKYKLKSPGILISSLTEFNPITKTPYPESISIISTQEPREPNWRDTICDLLIDFGLRSK
jgi:hypothetical protein